MPNVHAATAGTAACVKKECFAALVSIENLVKIAVTEEEAPT